MKLKFLIIVVFIVIIGPALLVSGPGRADAACSVRIGDLNWDSANFHDQVVAFILKHGYGCRVAAHLRRHAADHDGPLRGEERP